MMNSTVTLTRKLFTMLLSVFIYNHTLTAGQWLGAGIVFAGIGVEAWVKRRGSFFVVQLPSGLNFSASCERELHGRWLVSWSRPFIPIPVLRPSKNEADSIPTSSFNSHSRSHHHWTWRTPFLLALLWNPAADVHAKRVIKEQEKAKLKSL